MQASSTAEGLTAGQPCFVHEKDAFAGLGYPVLLPGVIKNKRLIFVLRRSKASYAKIC